MEKIIVKEYGLPEIRGKNIMICGLPGIGNVGKIVAAYIIEKMGMVQICDIYSEYFPPQVLINSDGVANLTRNSFFMKKLSKNKNLIIYTGDFQANDSEGQYELISKVLEMALKYHVDVIYTIGGYGIGKIVESPRILGAVSNISLKEGLEKSGVIFSTGEPGGGIIGMNGLIIGMSELMYGIPSACLMGETSGYFPDPKAAIEIIKVLQKIVGFKVDLSDLEERIKNIDNITQKIQAEGEKQQQGKGEDLNYFQ
ncbi:proteasome assembly chaperone family protein [Caldiplasma sukawensis]